MTLKVDGTNGVLQAYDYQVLTTGFSYTFAAGVQLLLAVPAGTLATGTVTMPASPVDGMNITITSTKEITALTVNANTGQSIVGGATTLAAGGSQTFVYRLANTTWYSQNNNTSAGLPGTQGQVFTSNGTFTIPSGVTAVKVTVVGGGAAGGATNAAGGGGAGGAAISYLTGLTPGATLAVTVGAAAGTSSVASGTQTISTISATGGTAGTAGTSSLGGQGGAGGIGSGGSLNIRGGPGASAGYPPPGYGDGGAAGGSSIFGGGASGSAFGVAANAGGAYGGGGSGYNAGSGAGGAGAAGVVVFEW